MRHEAGEPRPCNMKCSISHATHQSSPFGNMGVECLSNLPQIHTHTHIHMLICVSMSINAMKSYNINQITGYHHRARQWLTSSHRTLNKTQDTVRRLALVGTSWLYHGLARCMITPITPTPYIHDFNIFHFLFFTQHDLPAVRSWSFFFFFFILIYGWWLCISSLRQQWLII